MAGRWNDAYIFAGTLLFCPVKDVDAVRQHRFHCTTKKKTKISLRLLHNRGFQLAARKLRVALGHLGCDSRLGLVYKLYI